jgi:hypothetical protein
VKANQTGKQIAKEVLAGFEIESALKDIGDGDDSLGFDRAAEAAGHLGIETSKIIELARTGLNPETRLTNKLLKDRLITIAEIAKDGDLTEELAEESAELERILFLSKDRTAEAREQKKLGIAERDVLVDIKSKQDALSDAQAYGADQAERTAAAYDRIYDRISAILARDLPKFDF